MAVNTAGLSCYSVQSAQREAPPEPNKMTSNRLQVRILDVAKTARGWQVGLMAFSMTMLLDWQPQLAAYSPHRLKTILTAVVHRLHETLLIKQLPLSGSMIGVLPVSLFAAVTSALVIF